MHHGRSTLYAAAMVAVAVALVACSSTDKLGGAGPPAGTDAMPIASDGGVPGSLDATRPVDGSGAVDASGALDASSPSIDSGINSGIDASHDGGTPDTGAGSSDATTMPPDGGNPSCNALAVTDPMSAAALTGQIDILDFDTYDAMHGRMRVRNTAINFMTHTLPALPLTDAPLFTGIVSGSCITVDIPNSQTDLRPTRNIGTDLLLSGEQGALVHFMRVIDPDGTIHYDPSTQNDLMTLFDMSMFSLSKTWTWSTSGDPAGGVMPFSTQVGPVEDFQVTPAFTSTGAPVLLDPVNGTQFHWTAPVTTSGIFSIVLDIALNSNGDGRYVICRPQDNGSFLVPGAAIASLRAAAHAMVGLGLSRAAIAPFCNEGVPAGAVLHTIVYAGTAQLP